MNSIVQPVFVTSNEGKFREAAAILGTPLQRVSLDIPEIQGLDVVAVARDKVRRAFQDLGVPVLVEDTSLELQSLGGFPGPMVKWLLQGAGVISLCRLAAAAGDSRAVARCAALIWDGTREFLGVGAVAGYLVSEPRGSSGFGWDAVFAPDWGGGRTYAQMPDHEKNLRSHRSLALCDLQRRLTEPDTGQS